MDTLYTGPENGNFEDPQGTDISSVPLKTTSKKKYYVMGVILAFSLALLILLLLLFNNSGGLADPLKKTTITYWGLFESEEVMAPLIEKYEAEHPGTDIVYEERNYEDEIAGYKGTLKQRLKQGNGPGIFRMHITWGNYLFPEMAKNNTDKNYKDFSERFYAIAVDRCLVESTGDIYCLPLMYDGLALAYNKDMFFDEGLTPPKTWDEMLASAKRLTKLSSEQSGANMEIGGVALGSMENVQNASDILGLMLAQSKIKFPDGIDTEGGVKVIEYYQSFIKTEKVWSDNMPNSLAAFAGQKLGMVFVRQKDIETILNLNPTISMGVIPVPQIPTYEGGVTTETWGSFWVEAVSNDLSEADQKKAWEFLWWLSEQDQQTGRAKVKPFGELPANIKLYDSFSKLNYVGPILEQAPDAVTSIISDNSGNDDYVNALKSAVQLKGSGYRGLPEALSNLKKEIDMLNQGK